MYLSNVIDLDQIKSGKVVGLQVELISTRKHHGGKAKRGLSTGSNSAAAKRLARDLSKQIDLGSLFAAKEAASKKEASAEREAPKPYGHSGSVNVDVLGAGLIPVANEGKTSEVTGVQVLAINALNRFQNMKVNGSSLNIKEAIADYDAKKQNILAKYSVRGIIPQESLLNYNRDLAAIAFEYYMHQIKCTLLSKESLSELSNYSEELGCFKTIYYSIVIYTRSLLSDATRNDLRTKSEKIVVKCANVNLLSLAVYKDEHGRLRARANNNASPGSPGMLWSSEDDYT